jgi:MoaA/NifB/PqqE/SkfB family radical SAM enzyme
MSDTLCSYPFAHTDIEPNGEIKYCCSAVSGVHKDENGNLYNVQTHTLDEAWNSVELRKIRTDMIAGKKPASCSLCWQHEAGTGSSLRIKANTRIPLETLKDRIAEAKANDGRVTEQAFDFQVSPGNLCNLACKMCCAAFSTGFQKFFKRWHMEPDEVFFTPDFKGKFNHDTDFNTEFDWPITIGMDGVFKNHYSSLRSLFITGGEPTIIKENIDFLEKLVDLGYSEQIKIWPSTNCTNINKRLLDVMGKFQTIEFNLSLDGMDEIAYIQRTPSSWEHIEKNLDTIMAWQLECRKQGKHVQFNIISTLTNLNLHHIMDFWVYLLNRYPDNSFSICEPLIVWDKNLNFGAESVPQEIVDSLAKNIVREFTPRNYQKIKYAYNYLVKLFNESKFATDYRILHYCLDKVQSYHPELNVKEIYSIYYKDSV